MNPEKVNIYKAVIQDVLGDQKEAIRDKGMTVQMDIPDELEVICDPEHLQIVYNNLVSNAVKYGLKNTCIYI